MVRPFEQLRFFVSSASPKRRGTEYLVELDAFHGFGKCGCYHFEFRLEPLLSRGVALDRRERCGHLRRARRYLSRQLNLNDNTTTMNHDIKCWPEFFKGILDGSKPFEIRVNDRNYALGDFVTIREWLPHQARYTDRTHVGRITYLMHGTGANGIVPGYVVFGHAAVVMPEEPASPAGESTARPGPLVKYWPIGTQIRAQVLETTPVMQLLKDEAGEGHMIDGNFLAPDAKPGQWGTLEFVKLENGAEGFRFTPDA